MDNLKMFESLMTQFVKSFEENQRNNHVEIHEIDERITQCLRSVNLIGDQINGFSGRVINDLALIKSNVQRNDGNEFRETGTALKNMIKSVQGSVTKCNQELSSRIGNIHKQVEGSISTILKEVKIQDNMKFIRFTGIKKLIFELTDTTIDHEMYSDVFHCGGIKWKISIDVVMKKKKTKKHLESCNSANIMNCRHYKLGVFWHPQAPAPGEVNYFPIHKKLTVELVNNVGLEVNDTLITFENAKFTSEVFEKYMADDEEGYGDDFLDSNDATKLLQNGADTLNLKVLVADI